MRFLIFLITGFFLLLSPLDSAVARPLEIKSENFVLIGDVHSLSGKGLLLELEKYRFAILDLYNADFSTDPIPVRIYTVSGSRALKEISGLSGIGGVYTTNIEGPIFMIDIRGGLAHGRPGRGIAMHEYTHHLMNTYMNKSYPLWYSEGHANYFSTFKVNKEGKMVVGLLQQHYSRPLSAKKWLPAKTVFGSITRYPFVMGSGSSNKLDTADFFYAQAWLAVHYIQSHPEYAKKMNKYIDLFNSRQPPENIFETAFEVSMDDFQLQLKDYFAKNKYKVFAIKPTKLPSIKPMQVRSLSRGEFAFHKAEAMRYYRGAAIPTQRMIDQYKRATKQLGETPHILVGLAELATWQDDFDGAKTYIDRALAQAPDDPKVNHMAGMILVYKNEEQISSESELRQARWHLQKTIIAEPKNISAHFYYAKSFGLTNQRPNSQALASAQIALEYYHGSRFFESNLMLADVLSRAVRADLMRPEIE
ncbi:MAG: hypothetical protein L3J04_05075 [Robiginitomaculum sp.]|nr:hypothetical protein [Robiginitomaculum sp.]